MTHISSVFSMDLFEQMKAEGFIRVQVHPDAPYFIANYTEKAQYEKVWNEVTSACRGLIFDDQGTVLARPFQKFFNLGEYGPEFDYSHLGPARIYEKMDGSLGIAYRMPDGEVRIATRGSFTSDQALWATKWLKASYPAWQPEDGTTYLFEIVFPQNRIVVDYGDDEFLIALAAVDIQTGGTIEDGHKAFYGAHVMEHIFPGGIAEAMASQRENKEGFVLHFLFPDKRIKIKHEEYVRLHRLVTGVTARSIWELLANGKPLHELLEHVPDEFYSWVKLTALNLQNDVAVLMFQWGADMADALRSCGHTIQEINESHEARKAFADVARLASNPAALFGALDGKNIEAMAWKKLRPEATKPFRYTGEDVA